MFEDLPVQQRPDGARDPLDYDPTPPSATRAFLNQEAEFIRAHGPVVDEPCVGAGHIQKVLHEFGFQIRCGDLVDRGFAGIFCLGSFYDQAERRAPSLVSNPPYGEISSAKGGRWLRHSLDLQYDYIAYLLNADWSATIQRGMAELFRDHPPSIEYLCAWKIDFRGGGSPPQRNSWFVWDVNRPPIGPECWVKTRLHREKVSRDQASFDGM
jgi:hypothetical protein